MATSSHNPPHAGPEIEEFANALDDCLAPHLTNHEKRERLIDLPRKYYENALRRLAHVRPRNLREGTHDDVDMDVDEAESGNNAASIRQAKLLEKEAQTWDLVRRLVPHRFGTFSMIAQTQAPQNDIVREFLESDLRAGERRAVVQWLQTNASSGPDIDELARELQQNADRGDIIAHGWLHTRSSIKLRKSVTAWPHLLDRQSPTIANTHNNSDGAPLVTQLDPDAPTRQDRKLEPQDEYFERAIWLGCFEHLRRGSSPDVIREWCQERTEMWRYISSSPLTLSSDDSNSTSVNEPASLALWRRMCFGLARQGGCDDYERAVYGVLSGDISSVEAVALTWDDYLFANFNALLRSQLDNFILAQCSADVAANLVTSFPAFDAVQFHGDPETVEKRLMQALESKPQIRNEANEPTKSLQASFIARGMQQHLYDQGMHFAATRNEKSNPEKLYRVSEDDMTVANPQKFYTAEQHHGLRIVAHIYVLLSMLEKFTPAPNCDDLMSSSPELQRGQQNILASYTNYLRLARLPELIPLYCSILPETRSYEVLSYNLITEEESKQRLIQLRLIRNAGINVLEFVKSQAWLMFTDVLTTQNVRGEFPAKDSFTIIAPGPPTARSGRPVKPDFLAEDEDNIDLKHEYLIRSLEWLTLVNETWPEVFSIGTKVYKFFLRNLYLNAARQLMKRVSIVEIAGALAEQDEVDVGWFDDYDFVAQQLERCHISNVSPERVMSDARNFRELEALVRALDNMETVASMASLIEESPERKFWSEMSKQVNTTKDNFQPLLNNWLVSGVEEGDGELQELRQAYLPETIMAYVSTLHFAGTSLSRDHLLECMELAAVIAERNSDLADAFVKAGRMKELVEAFAACSKALAISTGEKRAVGTSSKKLRELGWSRDLWSVKP